jgi:hypothetical protein
MQPDVRKLDSTWQYRELVKLIKCHIHDVQRARCAPYTRLDQALLREITTYRWCHRLTRRGRRRPYHRSDGPMEKRRVQNLLAYCPIQSTAVVHPHE